MRIAFETKASHHILMDQEGGFTLRAFTCAVWLGETLVSETRIDNGCSIGPLSACHLRMNSLAILPLEAAPVEAMTPAHPVCPLYG